MTAATPWWSTRTTTASGTTTARATPARSWTRRCPARPTCWIPGSAPAAEVRPRSPSLQPEPGPTPEPEPQPEPSGDGGELVDTDGDGTADTVLWEFGDGTWQQLTDLDGDGNADVLVIDTNGDDQADYGISDNGDGTYTIYQDADGDGQWDEGQSFTRAELDDALPGVTDLLDTQIGERRRADPTPTPTTDPEPGPTPDPDGDTTDDGGVVSDYDGDGVADTVHWDFGDGTWQELWDVDGDQDADVLVIDTNGDESADYAITDNGDGSYTIYADSDGDGEWDDEGQTMTRVELDEALPGVGSAGLEDRWRYVRAGSGARTAAGTGEPEHHR